MVTMNWIGGLSKITGKEMSYPRKPRIFQNSKKFNIDSIKVVLLNIIICAKLFIRNDKNPLLTLLIVIVVVIPRYNKHGWGCMAFHHLQASERTTNIFFHI